MKKLLIFAAVATMFAACSKDATQDLAVAKPIDKFYATIADNDSRVQLNDACQTVWTAGDRVSVFNKTTGNRRYKFTGNTGDTTGELSYMNGGTTGSTIDKIIAIYPYNASNAVSTDGTITTFVPDTQTYCKDSFGVGSSIMIARSETEDLSFQNVMGWIRIALTGDKTIKSIILWGRNDEILAGKVTINKDLSVNLEKATQKILTLDCGDGVQLSDTPTYFYIAVAPQTFSNGFCANIISADNDLTMLETSKSITIGRGHIIPMAKSQIQNQEKPLSNQIWYTTSGKTIIVPKSYDGYIVSNKVVDGKGSIVFSCEQTSIGVDAFRSYSELTSVTIPDSVTEIGNYAFYNCTSLTSVTIPDSVTSIGKCAFLYCSNLTSITIGNGVTEIGSSAFDNCSKLTSVHITDLAAWCSIKFAYYDSNPLYYAHNLYLNGNLVTDLVIPNSVTSIGNYAFYWYTGLTSVTIPNSVNSIGGSAFSGCTGLKSVTIPDSVTSISWSAFYDCTGLTSVTIPDSVTEIGNYAFYNCTSLTKVNITDLAAWYAIKFGNGTSNPLCYAHNLYLNDNLVTDIVITYGTELIGDYSFYGCTCLTSVTIPDSVISIGKSAFFDCTGLTNAVIGKGVSSIGEFAFKGCKELTCINIPDGITQINYSSFAGCKKLTTITIPNGVTSIGGYAFSGCTGLTSVTIPDSVTSIGDCAFTSCSGILTVPNSVTTIGDYAFSYCTGELHIDCNIPACDYYPASSPTDQDRSKGPFLDAKFTKIVIGDSVTTIGDEAFYRCNSLKSITISDSVISIGCMAFIGCNQLKEVCITDIGSWCSISFHNYDSKSNPLCYAHNLYLNGKLVTDLVIPNGVTSISKQAFASCTSLTSVTIPESVSSIGRNAFNGCTNLTTVFCKPITTPWLDASSPDTTFDWNSLKIIYVPRASLNSYKSSISWRVYGSRIYGYDF